MRSKTVQVTVHEIGRGFLTNKEGAPIYSWPYVTYYTPGYKSGDFYVGDGDARNGGGTFIGARELLQMKWRSHLNITETLWLVPILDRIAGGETIEPSQVFAAYKQVHGMKPKSEEWDIFA